MLKLETVKYSHIIWAMARENLSSAYCTQQRRSLISAFIIRLLESIVSTLAKRQISIFCLVSVAEQAGFGMTCSQAPKVGFLASRPICNKWILVKYVLQFLSINNSLFVFLTS